VAYLGALAVGTAGVLALSGANGSLSFKIIDKRLHLFDFPAL
jgi:hypothetical protein